MDFDKTNPEDDDSPTSHVLCLSLRNDLIDTKNDDYVPKREYDLRASYEKTKDDFEKNDIDNLENDLCDLYVCANNTDISKHPDFYETGFVQVLVEILKRTDGNIFTNAIFIASRVAETAPETTPEEDFTGILVPFTDDNFLKKLSKIVRNHAETDVSVMRGISSFIYYFACYHESFRDILIPYLPIDLIFEAIISEGQGPQTEKQLNMFKILLGMISYTLDDSDLATIIKFVRDGIDGNLDPNAIRHALDIVFKVFEHNPRIVIESDLIEPIEKIAPALPKEDMSLVFDFYNLYLDANDNSCSSAPPFLVNTIDPFDKKITRSAYDLILRFTKIDNDFLPIFVRSKLLDNVANCLHKGSFPVKVATAEFLSKIVREYPEKRFLSLIVKTYCVRGSIESSIISMMTNLILPEDAYHCQLIINFLLTILDSTIELEAKHCLLKAFEESDGELKCNDVLEYEEIDDDNDERSVQAYKVSNGEEEEEEEEHSISKRELLNKSVSSLLKLVRDLEDTGDILNPHSSWKKDAEQFTDIYPHSDDSEEDDDSDYTGHALNIVSSDNDGYGESDAVEEDDEEEMTSEDIEKEEKEFEDSEHDKEAKERLRLEHLEEERKANLF